MKKILLANIGNRNITLKDKNGDFVEVVPYINKNHLTNYIILNERSLKEEFHFRNFTKDILEEWQLGLLDSDNFSLQILTEAELEANNYQEVYLFYTDQAPSKFAYQDTLYETELIEGLLSEKFPTISFNRVLVQGNPTDFNNLYQQYADFIKKVIQEKLDYEFTLLDAGGTTQMKMSSKSVFDYYAKQFNKKLEIRYVNHWSDNSFEVDRSLQSKFLLLELASDYIRSFDLEAACITINRVKNDDLQLNDLHIQTQILNSRLRFEQPLTIAEFQLKVNQPLASIENYIKNILPVGAVPFLNDGKNRKTVFEIASICQFYFQRQQFTLGVATFYRLSEEICQCFIEENTGLNFNQSSDRELFITQFTKGIHKYLGNNFKNIKYGLPTLLAYCKADNKQLQIFTTLGVTCSIVNGQQVGLNTLRNQCWLAHENQAIKKQDIEKIVPDFFNTKGTLSTLFSQIGLPKENVFFSSQKEILGMFQSL